MKYQHILKGTFVSRPNRFIARVVLDGADAKEVVCHVKNTGRCRELLIPGACVILEYHPDAAALGRKTSYSLIAVYKSRGGRQGIEPVLVNMDSQVPNLAAQEWLEEGGLSSSRLLPDPGFASLHTVSDIRREVTYGQSRFDLAFRLTRKGQPEKNAFMEVKGVTLEVDGTAMFPDAPTQRGVKHVCELACAAAAGFEAYILFVIQMKGVREFTPNRQTHPAFCDALIQARQAGVNILAYDCLVREDGLSIDAPVPVHSIGKTGTLTDPWP